MTVYILLGTATKTSLGTHHQLRAGGGTTVIVGGSPNFTTLFWGGSPNSRSVKWGRGIIELNFDKFCLKWQSIPPRIVINDMSLRQIFTSKGQVSPASSRLNQSPSLLSYKIKNARPFNEQKFPTCEHPTSPTMDHGPFQTIGFSTISVV